MVCSRGSYDEVEDVNISRQDSDNDADEARVSVICPWGHDALYWTKGNVH